MKTAIIYGPRDVRVEKVALPEVGPNDVMAKVKISGICGSDVHRYLGTTYGRSIWPYPMNSGHEYCGDVVQVGAKVERFREGDKVTLGAAWTQGPLGAFSEYILIPDADRRLHKLPPEVSYVDGAVLEPLTVALRSYYRPDPAPGERVLILGAGPIGLCVQLLCKARGVHDIIVSEPSRLRRDLAARIGGVTVDPSAEDLEGIVKSATDGSGVDVTFECAGAEVTLNQAFALTRRQGRISLVAHYRETPRFNVEDLVRPGMSVFGPGYGEQIVDQAIELIAEKEVDLAQMVTHSFPLEQAMEAFEIACDTDASIKVLFEM